MAPFSVDVKREVKERAGGYKSELSERTDRPVEFMHKYHGKGPSYNQPENCVEVLDMEHLAYHLKFYDEPEKIGLTKAQNIYAINQLAARVTQFSYNRGLLDEYDQDLTACMNGWDIYFEATELPTADSLYELLWNKQVGSSTVPDVLTWKNMLAGD